VADRLTGIDVHEEPGAEQSIARAPTGIAAFVGRALRGPLNRPVLIRSFADFERSFGGLWQPSTLSYCVDQFFESGGETALIVRVANGARPCSLSLPCSGETLELAAIAPGTREFLRAAVDYDGIGENEQDRFNLVLQRVRSCGSEHIEDQEIYRRLSIHPESSRFAGSALAESQLVRVAGAVPGSRPEPTLAVSSRSRAGYVDSSPDGDDGGPLTDYDIIGSAAQGTGLFALGSVEHFNFLCIPPLARDRDVGPSTLLVANRYCRDRRAILVVDPPSAWESPAAAIAGMQEWPLASDSAVMYFPRMLAYDKLRGRFESFAACGAVAGMLGRAGGRQPVWSPPHPAEAILRPGMRPMCTVGDVDRNRLATLGVNALAVARAPGGERTAARTLAGPGASSPDWRLLGRRRLALLLLTSIERGTRWTLFEPNGPVLWGRLAGQVRAFLTSLEQDGAFEERAADDRWFVICDGRINREYERDRGIVNLLFGFAAGRPGQFHCYLISHRAGGSRVKPVTVNGLQSLLSLPEQLLEESLPDLRAHPS